MGRALEQIAWWQDWMVLPLIGFAFGFVWVVDWFFARSDRALYKEWAKAAESLNATFRSRHRGFSDMRIKGTTEAGVEFEIKRVMTDRFGGVATDYSIEMADAAVPKFSIVGKGTVSKAVFVPRVRTDDPRLDDVLRVRFRSEQVHAYLTPPVLEAAAELVDRFTGVNITNSEIALRVDEVETDEHTIRATLTSMLDMARLISPQLALDPRH